MKQRVLALETRIQGDREAFAAAESALTQLFGLHEQAITLVQKSQTDGINDSDQTEDCISDIQKTTSLIEAHQEIIAEPHNLWSNLYDEIHSSYEFLSAAVSGLKHELENARSAFANIRSASRHVSGAMQWSGSYGVSITGSYGSDELENAQRALDSGDYQNATSYAAAAQREARSAISSAESRVASIRHQHEEAARARRRRRARSRASSSSSGLGISSSSNRSSSFGSRSSMSSSSRSSTSGSGFTRSGW
jgi:chromosome segregation ATPase